MNLVHFTRLDDKGSISFVSNKIIAFAENDEKKQDTSIFVMNAGAEVDEFIVGDNYGQVLSIMEAAKE